MIEVERLSKSYGSFRAVSDLSFRVREGEVTGFLGPNGAGKSTTLRILSGYLGPTLGDARIAGKSVVDEPLEAKRRIGYMPESTPLYPEMRVREYLAYRAELKGVKRGLRKAAVRRAVEDAGLGAMDGVLIGHLSKGYRQRVGLADALVASPPLLVLDEPTAGLDPNQIREVRRLIGRLRDKHTILLSTHILSEVEAVCTRGIVIARGKLVAEGSIDELRELQKARGARLRLRGDAELCLGIVRKTEGVRAASRLEDHGDSVRLSVEFTSPELGDDATIALTFALAKEGVGILEIVPRSSLEQAFAELTSSEGDADSADPPAESEAEDVPSPSEREDA